MVIGHWSLVLQCSIPNSKSSGIAQTKLTLSMKKEKHAMASIIDCNQYLASQPHMVTRSSGNSTDQINIVHEEGKACPGLLIMLIIPKSCT